MTETEKWKARAQAIIEVAGLEGLIAATLAEAAADEREACGNIVNGLIDYWKDENLGKAEFLVEVYDAIRAREQKP